MNDDVIPRGPADAKAMAGTQATGDRGPHDDGALLRRYAESRDEDAFAELVRRHLGLVYHAALRQCGGDAHRAEDVAQVVFTDLARKAGKLARRPVIAGWLYTSTRYAASQAVRTEARRQAREQKAHAMNEILSSANSPADPTADWERLRPVIDDALHALGERDREAVLLRFFEGRAFAEVGAKLSLCEDAARMRVERALDKLRAALGRRGITSTTAALGVALANQAAAVAPAGVAASVTGAALAGAATSEGAGAWLAFLTMSKIKVGIVGAIVVAVVAAGVVELRANRELRDEYHSLQARSADFGFLQRENQQLNSGLKELGEKNPEAGELARLRQRAAVLKARPPGVVDSDLKAASAWRNAGQATPEAANETFHWAILTGNLDVLANFVVFVDDRPENRAAFMSHFSDAVRARYPTPEKIAAAPYLGKSTIVAEPPIDAFAVTAGGDSIGAEGNQFRRMRLWYRSASGSEQAGTTAWQFTSHGWAPTGTFSLKSWQGIVPLLDPATGDPRPNRVPINVGR